MSKKNSSVLGLATCFNRAEKTTRCLESLIAGNPKVSFQFIMVDDNSTDGTPGKLAAFDAVEVINGSGNLFYSGGMRLAIERAKEREAGSFDFVMLFNDDVNFFDGAIERLIAYLGDEESIVVGAMCDSQGQMSYSGSVHTGRLKPSYKNVMSTEAQRVFCDTFCANCVLIPSAVFAELDNIDPVYRHAMGDFDYGWAAKRKGYQILCSSFFVGECNDNPTEGGWRDTKLSVRERIRKKETSKGLPGKEWFHYLRKNHGLLTAVIYSITPYVRILLKR